MACISRGVSEFAGNSPALMTGRSGTTIRLDWGHGPGQSLVHLPPPFLVEKAASLPFLEVEKNLLPNLGLGPLVGSDVNSAFCFLPLVGDLDLERPDRTKQSTNAL